MRMEEQLFTCKRDGLTIRGMVYFPVNFEENGKYKWYNVIFLTVMFMGIHLINVFNGWEATPNQLMFTFSLGIFLLALYIQTKSIIVPVIGHFCINSVADYFSLYATGASPLYIGSLFQPFYIFYAIVLIAMGVIILKEVVVYFKIS